MQSLFNIINFIYQEKKSELDIESISSFDGGKYFPQFVSLIFNEGIPDLIPNPKTPKNNQYNFAKTILFLNNHGVNIPPKKYNYILFTTGVQKEKLLLDVVKQSYFTMSENEILDKSNSILKSKGVFYRTINDIFSGKFLLLLLNVFTDGNVIVPNIVNEKSQFDEYISFNFHKAGVPLVIDENSFSVGKPIRFLIQVQIIFRIFSDKEIIIKPIIEPIIDQDDRYNKDESTVNAVNYFITNPDKKIKVLYDIFREGQEEAFLAFINKSIGETIKLEDGSPNEQFNQILAKLKAKFGNKLFKQNFSRKSRDCQKDFVKYLFKESISLESLKNRCKMIYKDFLINSMSVDEFYVNFGSLFLPLLQRVSFNQFIYLNLVPTAPPPDVTIDELHSLFKQLKVPFILTEDTTFDIDSGIVKLQLKIVLDRLSNDYIQKVSKGIPSRSTQIKQSPLLQTINAIGCNYGIRFSSFESLIDGRLLPYFIEILLQKSLDDNIELIKSDKMTEEESEKNVQTIIQYLKTVNKKFTILNLNFRDQKKLKNSAKLLCANLVNLFFIKQSRKAILERCNSITGTKVPVSSIESFSKGKPFFILLHFIIEKKINFSTDFTFLVFNDLVNMFVEAKVPMIINDLIYNNPLFDENIVYYQLQIIFDKIDYVSRTTKKSIAVVEKILQATLALSKMSILHSHIIAISAKAKNDSYRFQINRTITQTEIVRRSKRFYNHPESLEDGLKRLRELKNNEIERMNDIRNVLSKEKVSNPLMYWNPFDFKYERLNKFKIKAEINLNYSRGLIESSINLKYDGYSCDLANDLNNVKIPLIHGKKEVISKSPEIEKVYKIFVYNETSQNWEFKSQNFEQFIADKNYIQPFSPLLNVRLVVFVNSFEDELIQFNSNFLNTQYPNLDDEDDIFVYALSHSNKSDIKPIFLLFHAPNRPIHNLSSIAVKIYSFLFSISNIQIVLLNNDKILGQVEKIQFIYGISKNLHLRPNTNSKLILLANHPVTSYDPKHAEFMNGKGKFAAALKKLMKNKQGFPEFRVYPFNFNSGGSNLRNLFDDLPDTLKSSFTDINQSLKTYPNYELSGLYIYMKSQPATSFSNFLKQIISERFSAFSAIFGSEDDLGSYQALLDEFAAFTPRNDSDFNRSYRSIIYSCVSDKSEKVLTAQLDVLSNQQIQNLKKIIQKKIYWKPEELLVIKNSYLMLLEHAFYDLIITNRFGRIADLIYNDYGIRILNTRILMDKETILKIFEQFYKKIEEKNIEKQKDLRDDLIKSTKYIMKEIETVRDQEVIISDDKPLDKVIKQDF